MRAVSFEALPSLTGLHTAVAGQVEVPLPHRVQRCRTAGWRMPHNTVYVGRPSRWGNPYRPADYHADYPLVGYHGDPVRAADDWARMAVSDYRGWLAGRWSRDDGATPPTLAAIRTKLAGRNLACWCPLDHRCHADVLLELANTPDGAA